MAKEKKGNKLIFAIILFSILYIVFAFKMLKTELHLSPEWTVDISSVTEVSPGEKLLAYRLGQNIGYFTADGKVASHIPYPVKATISDRRYATFGFDSQSADFFDSTGIQSGTIDEKGFPFFKDDRMFIFLPGGTSFAVLDSSGKTQFKYENYAPITAFDSCETAIVAGYADGTLASLLNDGTVSQKFAPGGSNIEVILGAAISPDGSMIACVCGQDQQRFLVSKKSEGSTNGKITYHEYLPKNFNIQTLVQFSEDGNMVFFNYNGGLGIVDLTKNKSTHVPVEGRIIQIQESSDLLFILSENQEEYTLTGIELLDHPILQFSFKAECAFIRTMDDALFIGRDNKISRLTISRK
ncbi:MAG: hypothetical protein J6Y60_02750 [Treponema sp.]|nr:hypothetical protein [Treponema sp.]